MESKRRGPTVSIREMTLSFSPELGNEAIEGLK
jgi:hypothetical protein